MGTLQQEQNVVDGNGPIWSMIRAWIIIGELSGLHWCWWRMLKTKGFERCWRQVLSIFVTKIPYFSNNRQASLSKNFHPYQNSVTNINQSSPTLSYQHHDVIKITFILSRLEAFMISFQTWSNSFSGWYNLNNVWTVRLTEATNSKECSRLFSKIMVYILGS